MYIHYCSIVVEMRNSVKKTDENFVSNKIKSLPLHYIIICCKIHIRKPKAEGSVFLNSPDGGDLLGRGHWSSDFVVWKSVFFEYNVIKYF